MPHHATPSLIKPHERALKHKSLQEWRAAWAAARAESARARELAAWVAWRCPQLWKLAGLAIERRMGDVRPSPLTMQGGRLVEALRLAGVMGEAATVRAMRPYAELEGLRVAYARRAIGWGVAAPLRTGAHRTKYKHEHASDA